MPHEISLVEGVALRQFGTLAVAIDVRGGRIFRLSRLALSILQIVAHGPIPIEHLLGTLESAYHVPRTVLVTDLSNFIQDARRLGLLQSSEG